MGATRERTSARRVVLRVLRIVVMLLLITYVLYRARLTTREGWVDLQATLSGSHLGFLALSFLFTPVLHFQSTIKWYGLTRARQMNVSLGRLFYFFVVGRFYNLVLPSNIGGDLIRVHMLGTATGRYADAGATVFVERLTGLITLVVYAFCALTVATVELRAPWVFWAVVATLLVVVAICWPILDPRPARLAKRLLEGRAAIVDRVMAKVMVLRKSIAAFRGMPGALAGAFVNSVIFYMLAVINTWLSVRVFDAGTPLSRMFIAVPILMFFMNIPVSVGNFGVMEFAYTFVLGAFGVSPQVAVSTVLLMRLKSILAAAGGAIAHAVAGDETPDASVAQMGG